MIGGPTAKPSRCVDRVKIEGGAGDRLGGSNAKQVAGYRVGRRQIGRHAGRLCSMVADGVESGVGGDISM